MEKMRVRKTDDELAAMAREMATYIWYRNEQGRYSTSEKDNRVLRTIFYGALLELNRNGGSQFDYGVLNCAEMTADLFIPYMNGYDTVFCPLKRVLENWETE